MESLKTFFAFRDGEISEAARYDWDMSVASTVETIKCFLSALIEEHRLSGRVLIEVEEGIRYVDYDVAPKEYEACLRSELSKRCYVFARIACQGLSQ